MDEDAKARRPQTVVGEPLDTLSVAELEERIRTLQAEVERTRATLAAKQASLDKAASFFKR